MVINGREYNLLLTVKARRAIRNFCPEGKLERIAEIFDDGDGLEGSINLILALSRGYEEHKAYWDAQKGQVYEACPITEEILENLSMAELHQLNDEAADAFMKGMGVSVETEPVKEKGKKKAREIPSNLPTRGSSSTDTSSE